MMDLALSGPSSEGIRMRLPPPRGLARDHKLMLAARRMGFEPGNSGLATR